MFKQENKTPQIYIDPIIKQTTKAVQRCFTSMSQLSLLPSTPVMIRLREEVSSTTINLSKIHTLCLLGNNTKQNQGPGEKER